MATEVGEVFKEKLGDLRYSNKLAECHKESATKYESRKRREKELAVVDPAGAAIKKQRKHVQKSAARKRKLDELKPYRVLKRKRRLEAQKIHQE